MPDGSGRYVDCCRGKAYVPVKADVSVPSENVVVTRKPVLYKGRFATISLVLSLQNTKANNLKATKALATVTIMVKENKIVCLGIESTAL